MIAKSSIRDQTWASHAIVRSMWRKCGGKRDCVKIAKNDFGKCMFEDPYSTLKSQSLFRSRPLYQDMLGLSFCMGNTMILALRAPLHSLHSGQAKIPIFYSPRWPGFKICSNRRSSQMVWNSNQNNIKQPKDGLKLFKFGRWSKNERFHVPKVDFGRDWHKNKRLEILDPSQQWMGMSHNERFLPIQNGDADPNRMWIHQQLGDMEFQLVERANFQGKSWRRLHGWAIKIDDLET